ncbi:DNA polymerase III subunit gamma/tau [Neisseria sp. ZJ106]|uniref:DNA polymerase III subunit gamma/tau n=1 Tax=Neisseria lisongii TaxID=2912188 RepID=A0ABY7RHK3_9NEIS|nr:DNA polymerase III subunit gamma/tau [Neisseria lisongii]MCF7520746.1 DNA polymerase III subunit gamma/tau [Neisseria lisongii]WCL70688.1 DNA polymerase III subunit gamma/tau [Neisseria lisongii]
MAYQVLARKWRPKNFADLVGQEHVVKALRNALDEGRLHHAYLLTGTRGVGKTTIARILAKSLNCLHAEHGEPCGVCESCTQIDAGRYVDLLEIDAASNTGIDNIREVLENAQYAPTSGKYKIYIIDEVHMLSKSAFNAMLKTLEEPPEHVKFILATTDPHKVPITVLSRCLQFVLRNMTTQQVAAHLAHVLDCEQIAYEPAALQILGRAAAGSMRDALSLLDQAIAMGAGSVAEQDVRQMIGAVDKRYLYELLQGVVAQNGEMLLAKAQEMAARSIGFDSALNELAMLLQRLAMIQLIPTALAKDDPEHDILHSLAQAMSGEQIQLYYQCVIHGKQDLGLAPDEYAGFVMTLLRMLAFAPFAAQNHQADGHIEQLQEAVPAKKPDIAANTPAETPQAEPLAETPQHVPDIAAPIVPPPVNVATANEAPPNAAEEDDVPPWEEIPPPEYPMPSENRRFHQNGHHHVQPEETPPVAPVETPEEAAEIHGDEEDEPDFVAYPDFKPENWAAIVKRFARRFGAAQMPAQHAAWIRYDEAAQLMVLALATDARATVSKDHLDKIRNVLSEAYRLPLKLQTEPWQDGENWETPHMRSRRLQQEGRAQAQALLEADPAARQILQIFEADWQPDSLILHAAQE